jgi:flagellar hook-associated protein 2
MSTTSSSSSTTGTTTGYLLSSLGGTQQITGLASGLDTNSIITAEMAIYEQPETILKNKVKGVEAQNTQLTNIQTQLQTLAADAQALGSSSLFATTQSVSSSDPTRVTGTSSTGAGIGGYQVSVSKLANSAQRTFTYASPTSAGSLSIDGQSVSVSSGESITNFVNSINSNKNLDVYAAATDSGTVVLSNRATGDTGTGFIAVTGAGTTLTEQTTLAKQGQDAQFSVDGVSGTSHSNTVTNGIAGVSLTLSGVTTTGPVTVNIGAPQPSSSNVESAVNTFITQYNSVLSQIQTQLSQTPSSSDPTQGTLYQDSGLSNLLSSMRSAMIKSGSGLPTGLASMLDIGVSTGATTGSGAVSSSALAGNLTFNASTFESQLSANPSGVQSALKSWASSFSAIVNNEAQPGGAMAARITGDDQQTAQLNNQISVMQAGLTDKQNALVQQFAQLESSLSTNQSTSSWLTSQLTSLPGF